MNLARYLHAQVWLLYRIDSIHNKKVVEAIHAEVGGDIGSIRGKCKIILFINKVAMFIV